MTLHPVCIPAGLSGARLDKALSALLPGFSRSRIQQLLAQGCVTRDGSVIADASQKVKPEEEYRLAEPPPVASHIAPVAMNLRILFEDAHMLIIDKPPGMTVHPAPGHRDDTLVNALLAHCGASLSGIGGVTRPGIVHRIDKDTSGLLAVAKHDEAHKALAAQLANRSLKRVYQCVVWGAPSPPSGRISGNIGRSPKNRQKMAVLASGGKEAVTHYRTLETFAVASSGFRVPGKQSPATRNSQLATAALVECRLETGRTHQIRVHMKHSGHALVGDPVYGASPRGAQTADFAKQFPRQALHAAQLALLHPITLKPMEFLSPLPEDMQTLILQLRALKNRP
jgi:23S rRNA pseudouridine1911/1915/1917 synthase